MLNQNRALSLSSANPAWNPCTLSRSLFLSTLKQELKLDDEENGGTMESRDKRVSRYILF